MVIVALCAVSTVAEATPTATIARMGATSPQAELQLVLPLKADLPGLAKLALAISTPGSSQYRRYETIPDLARRFGASLRGERRVIAYLRSHGATQIKRDATGLFIDVTLRAGTAERMFSTELSEFHSLRAGTFTAPAVEPKIPTALRGLVTGVIGLNTEPVATAPNPEMSARAAHRELAAERPGGASSVFGPIARAAGQQSSAYQPASGTPSGCQQAKATGSFTPNQYLTAYNYPPLQNAGLTGAGERMALIEIDGFKMSDVDTFAACFGLTPPPIKAFGVGITKALAPGSETTLDLEVMTAAAPGLKEIDVYESSSDEAQASRALTSPLQNTGAEPDVISASLGLCEPVVDNSIGVSGLENTEGALEEAAAAGISFLDASGDSGSADCLNNDGQPLDHLAVNYPTTSWWVTGVGGTNVKLNSANQLTAQIVWNDAALQPGLAAGGGKSQLFLRPPYQKGTVSPNRREVPDVAMLADVAPGYVIYCSVPKVCTSGSNPDPWQGVGGTSAATPLLAGGFALVDQDLRQHARPDLGLANPLIYDIGRSADAGLVFSDVTAIGDDVGPFISSSHRALGCCTAHAGYDDASGWGSVSLTGFAAAALAAPAPTTSATFALPAGQHPIAAHELKVTVTCSTSCSFVALGTIQIGNAKGQTFLGNGSVTLTAAGSRTVPIKLPAGEVSKLRAARRQGKRITASVRASVFGVGDTMVTGVAPATMRITS